MNAPDQELADALGISLEEMERQHQETAETWKAGLQAPEIGESLLELSSSGLKKKFNLYETAAMSAALEKRKELDKCLLCQRSKK